MKSLSVNYIQRLVGKLISKLQKSILKRQYDKAIIYMKTLSYMRYWFFLGYKDELIESGIHCVSEKIEKKEYSTLADDRSIIFLDTICSDTIGLTQQYIDALIDAGYKIFYIYEKGLYSNGCDTILNTLNSYSNAKLIKIPANINKLQKAQWLYNYIISLNSRKIIYHTGEWAIEECIALYSLPKEVVRYKIDLADHTFWPGKDCLDYLFEFRDYGANVSLKYRGLKKEQLIYMPFYPAMKEISFAGFPPEARSKVVFLTGGAPYKVVDENNTFFRLCRDILNKCPNSVILFAGATENNKIISKAKEEFRLGDRFIPIDYRKDIFEVFKHSDVYINTYPIGGGLMCQYAAQCSIPIINYLNENIEECVAQKGNIKFTSFNEIDFIDEAFNLYNDTDYRNKRGMLTKDCVISKDEFNKNLDYALNTNNSLYRIKENATFLPRDLNIQDKINFRNKSLIFFYYDLYEIMGHYMFSIMPMNFLELYPHIVKRGLKAFWKK